MVALQDPGACAPARPHGLLAARSRRAGKWIRQAERRAFASRWSATSTIAITCYWPAQVPDHMNNYPDWSSKCAVATKDWRNLDLVFP